jgi:phage terminase large subunit-like protein
MSSRVESGERFARDVVAGKIPACLYVKQACRRHLDNIKASKRKDYPFRFDREEAERRIKFTELLPHTKGEWAKFGKRVTLEPWQIFGMMCMFGWLRKKDGTRRFREAYWEIPRKNGKSVIAAAVALALALFCIGREYGAEMYSGATTEKQAWEVFRPARLMVQRTPELQEAAGIVVNAKSLYRPDDGSRLEPVIGNPGDGASPSGAIVDEYHEHASADLYETMQTGMGARTQPLMFVITTAGADIEGPCYELRGRAVEMLAGIVEDDELFAWIWTIDEGDDWTDATVLRKANPNFGVAIYEDNIRAAHQRAIRNARLANAFKTKHLNIWDFVEHGHKTYTGTHTKEGNLLSGRRRLSTAEKLEYGTSEVAAQPFMRPAANAKRNDAANIVISSMEKTIADEKAKKGFK